RHCKTRSPDPGANATSTEPRHVAHVLSRATVAGSPPNACGAGSIPACTGNDGFEQGIMKLAIIGTGNVGAATAMAAAARARVREILRVNRNPPRAKAVATALHYGASLSPGLPIRDGDYGDLVGTGVAVITAGVNEKAGGATDRSDPAGRLRLLEPN